MYMICTVPSAPQDVRAFSGVIVWGPPVEPNGEITEYQVRFIGTFSRNQTVCKGPTERYSLLQVSWYSSEMIVLVHVYGFCCVQVQYRPCRKVITCVYMN